MSRGPTSVFFGPRRRGVVVRAIAETGHWHGKRGPMTIRIERNPVGNIEGQHIEFAYTIYRASGRGFADSASDAIEKIESIYQERTPDNVRRDKPNRKRKQQPDADTGTPATQ